MGSECCSESEVGRTVIMEKKHCAAIVLAGGQGKRMGTKIQKQYLDISGKPLIYYSLHVFEQSQIIDEVILVVGSGEIEYVQENIVDFYHFNKVSRIVEGGKERYDSVWNGLQILKERRKSEKEESFVFIHDCARPFVNKEMLERAYEGVEKYRACVVGVPSKDTVKLSDRNGFAASTPERDRVWIVQTPQVFESSLIIEAYSRMMKEEHIQVTDDAMAVEQQMHVPVKLVMGSYENIKITTAGDLDIAEIFVKKYKFL